MSTEIISFDFHGNEVRAVLVEGEPWVVATDVAKILEFRDAKNMIRMLDYDESDTHNVSIRSANGVEQKREVAIINESGLNNAILKSRKENVRPFRRWVKNFQWLKERCKILKIFLYYNCQQSKTT